MTDWNKLKVVDLKAELKKRGLAQTGLKPALIARLAEHENTESPILPTPAVSFVETTDSPKETSVVDTQPEPTPSQPVDTVESSQVSAQVDTRESALPSVEPQEAVEDRQKRKRRSQSPPPSTQDSRKRYRGDEEQMDGVDTAGADVPRELVTFEDVSMDAPAAAVSDVRKDEVTKIPDDTKTEVTIEDVKMGGLEPKSQDLTREGAFDESPTKTRDSRQFKDLFTGDAQSTAMAISTSHDSAYEEGEPDRIISPALHPATSALYIRDIMRPLNLHQFRLHVALLAAPPGQEADLDVIKVFYIDPIRTHAFVSFTNTSTASRVRSALHDRIWPDEKTRKPLWVDFIPVDTLGDWIEQEQEAAKGGRGNQKKWEVYYDVDQDRQVTAMLQEANSLRPLKPIRRPSAPVPPIQAPQGPRRGSMIPPSAPRSFNIRGLAAPPNTDRLNEMFRSTTAKPMLYYQPVSQALANKRLDNIDAAMSNDVAAGKKITGPINRYTFEDGDKLVDRGPEIFPGIKPPSRSRQGGPGGPGGPPFGGRGAPPRDHEGGYGSRGGGGAQYRDYRDRPSGRTYESFRPGQERDDRRY